MSKRPASQQRVLENQKKILGRNKLQQIDQQQVKQIKDSLLKIDDKKKTNLFLKTISFDSMISDQKQDIPLQTNASFNSQSKLSTVQIKNNEQSAQIRKPLKNSKRYLGQQDYSQRNHSEMQFDQSYIQSNKTMDINSNEINQNDSFKQNLNSLVNQLNVQKIDVNRDDKSQQKTQNCTLQQDFYKQNDPCFQIFQDLKQYKGEIPKDEKLQQFSYLYNLLYESQDSEVDDIQFVSHKEDILGTNKIIAVIHEEYQDIEKEVFEDISQCCSNNYSVHQQEDYDDSKSAKSEFIHKKPIGSQFRVKQKSLKQNSQQNESQQNNHFESFDQDYQKIQTNLEKNKEILNKKISIKTTQIRKLNK